MNAYMQLDSGTIIETTDPSLWPEAKRLPATKGKALLKAEARAHLLEILKPGDTVHTILRHVSRSGMRRRIDLYKLEGSDRIYLSSMAARVLNAKLGNEGIVTDGCGMDMGFHLVYNLSCCLWPDGFDCIGKGCPSNDHFNHDESKHHRDGGYALRHRWL